MKTVNIIFFLGFCIFSFCINAQSNYSDSLKNKLETKGISVKDKFSSYNKLVEWYRVTQDYQKASQFNLEYLKLAKEKKNYLEQAKALVNQGVLESNRDNYELSQKSIDSLQIIAKKTNSSTILAYSYYLQGYLQYSFQEYDNAIKLFQQTIINVENTDENFIKAKSNYLLYSMYTNWNDIENSLLYATRAIEFSKKAMDINLLSNSYAALAVSYTYLYDTQRNKKFLDSVFENTQKAINLYHEYPGQVGENTYAIASLNQASYYLKYYPEQKEMIRTDIYNVLKVTKNIKDHQNVIASCYGILSALAREENNLEQAENYLTIAYSTLFAQEPINHYTMINITKALSSLYAEKGDYKLALQFQIKLTEHSDLLYNKSQAESAKRIEAQYQFEKKEREVTLFKEKAATHKKQNYLFAGLILIGAIGTFFMFRSYHFNLKYSLTREKQLNAEKEETEIQVKFEKEEQARLKAEQQLLSMQQQKLQNEVMANQLHLQHKNEILQQLKEKLKEEKDLNIKQLIKEENLLDADFEKAKFQIQEIHPDFFKVLNYKSEQKLTSLDLKYCAYLYLGMDTKQIANLLNVEAKSVRMTKYRLKQKIGLGKDDDLQEFFRKIN